MAPDFSKPPLQAPGQFFRARGARRHTLYCFVPQRLLNPFNMHLYLQEGWAAQNCGFQFREGAIGSHLFPDINAPVPEHRIPGILRTKWERAGWKVS